MMERYKPLFSQLAARNEGAFVPFVTLGDPNTTLSLKIIDTLIAAGADALELGIPFSDPLADGPTIQNSTLRAISSGVTLDHCFEMLALIHKKYQDILIGLLMYANLVFNNGIDAFYSRCTQSGIDSVLVADVPMEESLPFRNAAMRHGVAPIFICPPNANEDFLLDLALHGRAYTYILSRAGVTGSEKSDTTSLYLLNLIKTLTEYHAAPILQGFGIYDPAQVRNTLQAGAAGAISGSSIVRIISNHVSHPTGMLDNLDQLVRNMKYATRL
jgi:tryptophan synthase alpha chain